MAVLHDGFKSSLSWSTPARNVLKSETAMYDYMRAIAFHRLSDVTAREVMQELVVQHPDDPFYHEFLVTCYLPQARRQPPQPLMRRRCSSCLKRPIPGRSSCRWDGYLALNDPQSIEKAIIALEKAHRNEPEWAFVKRQLGIGLGKAGRFAAADLILAEKP